MDNLKNRKEMIITVKPEEIIESALGVKYTDLRTVHNFMYYREVNVDQKELPDRGRRLESERPDSEPIMFIFLQ